MQASPEMSSFAPPVQVVIGPPHHGVAEYAADLAEAVVRCEPRAEILRFSSAAEALEQLGGARRRVHLHVTDALFGVDLQDAATQLDRLTRDHDASLTLHDLPQESDGERNLERRSIAYARFIRRAVGVAVSSRHEAALFRDRISTTVRPEVIPLGTRQGRPPHPEPEAAGSGTLTILMSGYVYPGKGHDLVLEAAAALVARGRRSVRLTILGGVVPRHADQAERLARRAAETGVALEITGYLGRADYVARLGDPGVPVVAHQHYSASRSLLDWAEAGRRAVVVDSRYSREMAELRPGTLELAGGQVDALAASVHRLAGSPERTWLSPDVTLAPTLDDAAESSLAWWRTLPW